MEFFDLIMKRRSVRDFRDIPVGRDHILKILNAANLAPSAMNRRPWKFIVVSGEKINIMGESFRKIIEEMGVCLAG